MHNKIAFSGLHDFPATSDATLLGHQKRKRPHLLHANGAHIIFHIVKNTRDSWHIKRGFLADCSCARGRQNKEDILQEDRGGDCVWCVDLLADIVIGCTCSKLDFLVCQYTRHLLLSAVAHTVMNHHDHTMIKL